MITEMRLLSEHPRPSEVEALFSSQRRIAVAKLDDPKFKEEREQCAALLGDDPGGAMQRLTALGQR